MPTTEFKVGDVVQLTKKELAGSVGVITKVDGCYEWSYLVRFIALIDPNGASSQEDESEVERCDSNYDGFKLLCHAEGTDGD